MALGIGRLTVDAALPEQVQKIFLVGPILLHRRNGI